MEEDLCLVLAQAGTFLPRPDPSSLLAQPPLPYRAGIVCSFFCSQKAVPRMFYPLFDRLLGNRRVPSEGVYTPGQCHIKYCIDKVPIDPLQIEFDLFFQISIPDTSAVLLAS